MDAGLGGFNIDHARYRLDWVRIMVDDEDNNDMSELSQLVAQAEEILGHLDLDIYHTSSPLPQQGTCCRGRPKFEILEEQLELFLEYNFSVEKIAKMLGVSSKTIHRRLKQYGLSVKNTYSDMNDNQLDRIVSEIVQDFPNSGYKAVRGHLISRGVRVQESRIRYSMRRVDPVGVRVRGTQIRVVNRRTYFARAPLSTWHIDGNHKLKR
jgi:AraC-like DNA-binding protein